MGWLEVRLGCGTWVGEDLRVLETEDVDCEYGNQGREQDWVNRTRLRAVFVQVKDEEANRDVQSLARYLVSMYLKSWLARAIHYWQRYGPSTYKSPPFAMYRYKTKRAGTPAQVPPIATAKAFAWRT